VEAAAQIKAPEVCIGASCQTSWPAGGSGNSLYQSILIQQQVAPKTYYEDIGIWQYATYPNPYYFDFDEVGNKIKILLHASFPVAECVADTVPFTVKIYIDDVEIATTTEFVPGSIYATSPLTTFSKSGVGKVTFKYRGASSVMSSNARWRGSSLSNDGQYQTAAKDGGFLYISSNTGTTWTGVEDQKFWFGIAVSSSGQYQSAVAWYEPIHISTDYGVTWTTTGPTGLFEGGWWRDIAISDDGQYQTAVVEFGQIHVSSDFGMTWGVAGSTLAWYHVSMSSTGQYQAATAPGSEEENRYIYISSDYGITWSTAGPSLDWLDITISNSGQYILASSYAEDGIGIRISSDYGVSWSEVPAISSPGGQVSISSDGQYMVSAFWGEQIRVSSDYGANWGSYGSAKPWSNIVISATGQYQTAVTWNEQIYTSSDYGVTWTVSPIAMCNLSDLTIYSIGVLIK
jgi:hypothetical protein